MAEAEPLRSEPDRVKVSRGLLQPNSSSDTATPLCLHHMTALEIPEDNSHVCLNRSKDSQENYPEHRRANLILFLKVPSKGPRSAISHG